MTAVSLSAIAVVAVILAFLVLRRARRLSPHQRALRDVLDAADALEDRLRIARTEITAVAGESGAAPVGDAMKEMLRQRLWLRDHGADATPQQLSGVRAAIDDARSRIEHQLQCIEQARSPRG
ncbi:MAG: hypothetical protein EPO46_11190 [Lysobacter sp.]|nr:MAG: hypothetical protein EPO46_11190 [Lysobacter sp.]